MKTTALDLLAEEIKQKPIVTFCKAFDDLLGHGIPMGVITEFAGPPGSGKTQFCLQICCNSLIPESFGGVNGNAIYIDTNQGFNPKRLKVMVTDCLRRCENMHIKEQHTSSLDEFESRLSSALRGIHYMFAKDYIELIAALEKAKSIISSSDHVKVIVIDSFSFLFRNVEKGSSRTGLVFRTLTDLQCIATRHKLAVVLTNEITTRILHGKHILCPALGDSFAHKVGQRIILGGSLVHNNRIAVVEKCFNGGHGAVPFKITEYGVRGHRK